MKKKKKDENRMKRSGTGSNNNNNSGAGGEGSKKKKKNKPEGYEVTVSPTSDTGTPLDKDVVAAALGRLLGCTVLRAEARALPAETAMFVASSALRTREDAAVCVTIAEEAAAVRAGDLELKLEDVLGQPVAVAAPRRRATAAERLAAVERDALTGAASAADVVAEQRRVARERYAERFVRSIDRGEERRAERHAIGTTTFDKRGAIPGAETAPVELRPRCTAVVFGCPPRMDSVAGAAKLLYEALVERARDVADASDGGGKNKEEKGKDKKEGEKETEKKETPREFYRRVLLVKSKADVVTQVVVRTDRSGSFKGTLYVEFADPDIAAFAIAHLSRTFIDGKRITLRAFDASQMRTSAAHDCPTLTPQP